MTRQQRYKHEMLVRVRDFGAAHAELFPESSAGGSKFAQVTAAVAAIEDHMKNRVLGHAGRRGVNPTTRAAVVKYMRTLAQAARRLARQRRNQAPFVPPRRKTLKVEVATARAFLEEAEKRQAQFIGMGLPETFISDFRALVDELDQAVNGRLSGKTLRGHARVGIAGALRQGLELVRDLDLAVSVAAGQDDVVLATWRIARRIEGQGTSSPNAEAVASDVAAPSPPTPAAEAPASAITSPPVVEVTPTTQATPETAITPLERAS